MRQKDKYELGIANYKGQLKENLYDMMFKMFKMIIIHVQEIYFKDDDNEQQQKLLTEKLEKNDCFLVIIIRDSITKYAEQNQFLQENQQQNKNYLLRYKNKEVLFLPDLRQQQGKKYQEYLTQFKFRLFEILQKEKQYSLDSQNFYDTLIQNQKVLIDNNIIQNEAVDDIKYSQSKVDKILDIIDKQYEEKEGFLSEQLFPYRKIISEIHDLKQLIWKNAHEQNDIKKLDQLKIDIHHQKASDIILEFIDIFRNQRLSYKTIISLSYKITEISRKKSTIFVNKDNEISKSINDLEKNKNNLSKEQLQELKKLKELSSKSEKNLKKYVISLDIFWREVFSLLQYNKNIIPEDKDLIIQTVKQCCDYGESFELIDGDNSLINFQQLNSLAQQFKQKDDNILVISVLGTQSTGKSTLLNYLFGCQFLSAAGRCTRGIYLSMIKVDDSIMELVRQEFGYGQKVNFKYIIILDTEGLDDGKKKDSRFDKDITLFTLAVSHVILLNVCPNFQGSFRNIIEISAYNFQQMKKNKMRDNEAFIVYNKQAISDNGKDTNTYKEYKREVNDLSNNLKQVSTNDQIENLFAFKKPENLAILGTAFNSEQFLISGDDQITFNTQAGIFSNHCQELADDILQGFLRVKDLDYKLESWLFQAKATWDYMQLNPIHHYYDSISEIGKDEKIKPILIKLIEKHFVKSPIQILNQEQKEDKIDNYYTNMKNTITKEFENICKSGEVLDLNAPAQKSLYEKKREELEKYCTFQKRESLFHFEREQQKKKIQQYKNQALDEVGVIVKGYKGKSWEGHPQISQDEFLDKEKLLQKKKMIAEEEFLKTWDTIITKFRANINVNRQCKQIFDILEDNYTIVGLKMYPDPDHFTQIQNILKNYEPKTKIGQVIQGLKQFFGVNLIQVKDYQFKDLDFDNIETIYQKLDKNQYLNLQDVQDQIQQKYPIAFKFLKEKKMDDVKQNIFQDLAKLAKENTNWDKITEDIYQKITKDKNLVQKFSSTTVKLIRGYVQEIIQEYNNNLDIIGLQLDGEGEITLHYFSMLIQWKILSCIYIEQYLQPLEELEIKDPNIGKSYKDQIQDTIKNAIIDNKNDLQKNLVELTFQNYYQKQKNEDSLILEIEQAFENIKQNKKFQQQFLMEITDSQVFDGVIQNQNQENEEYKQQLNKEIQHYFTNIDGNQQKVNEEILLNKNYKFSEIKLAVYLRKQLPLLEQNFEELWLNQTQDNKQQFEDQFNQQIKKIFNGLLNKLKIFKQFLNNNNDSKKMFKIIKQDGNQKPSQEMFGKACFELVKRYFFKGEGNIIQKEQEFEIENYTLQLFEQFDTDILEKNILINQQNEKENDEEGEQKIDNEIIAQFNDLVNICNCDIWIDKNQEHLQQIYFPMDFIENLEQLVSNLVDKIQEEFNITTKIDKILQDLKQQCKTQAIGCNSQCQLCKRKCKKHQDHIQQNEKDKHQCSNHIIRGMNGIQQGNILSKMFCEDINPKQILNIKKKNGENIQKSWEKLMEEKFSDWNFKKQDLDGIEKQKSQDFKEKIQKIWNNYEQFFCDFYTQKNIKEKKVIPQVMKPRIHYTIIFDYSSTMRRKDQINQQTQQLTSKWNNAVNSVMKLIRNQVDNLQDKISLDVFKFTHKFRPKDWIFRNDQFDQQNQEQIIMEYFKNLEKIEKKEYFDQFYENPNQNKQLYIDKIRNYLQKYDQVPNEDKFPGSGCYKQSLELALKNIKKLEGQYSSYRILMYVSTLAGDLTQQNMQNLENYMQQMDDRQLGSLSFCGLMEQKDNSMVKKLQQIGNLFLVSNVQADINVEEIEKIFEQTINEQDIGFDI